MVGIRAAWASDNIDTLRRSTSCEDMRDDYCEKVSTQCVLEKLSPQPSSHSKGQPQCVLT
jgi:hypothetical protein